MASAYQNLKDLLDKNNVDYQELKHSPVFTSAQAARIRDTNESDGAKALVMIADKNPILLVLPGNRQVDFKKFKNDQTIKDLRMATPEEVKEVTSVPIGAVHPWGSLTKIPTFVDPSLGDSPEIIFNAGLHDRSIKLNYQDYLKLEKPTVVSFTQ